MKVSAKDKRIKELMKSKPGAPVKGLQPAEAMKIRIRIDVLGAADTLKEVADAHPEWRVHRWKGKVQWSIDVLGNTRLLFDYLEKVREVDDMTYDDPH